MRRHCLYSLIIYGYIHPMTDLTAFVCRVFAAVETSLSTLCPEFLFFFSSSSSSNICFYLLVWFPIEVAFMASVIPYLYCDYIQYPVIYLICMCCFGVNYNVVICKTLCVSWGQISFSAVCLQCNYYTNSEYLFASEKITADTTTDIL